MGRDRRLSLEGFPLRRGVAMKLAAIWLVVAIPLSIVLLVTYYAWYSARVSSIEQERLGYARLAGTSFRLLVEDIQHTMQSTGELHAAGDPSSPVSMLQLRRIQRPYPAAYTVLADLNGRVVGASQAGLTGRDFSKDPAFRAAVRAEGHSATEPSHVASGGIVGFHVAQGIEGPAGRLEGVMLMLVDVRKLQTGFPVGVPAGGISIVDASGQVVFQNEAGSLAERRADWGRFPFVREALRGRVSTTRDFRFPLGGRRIAAFVPIETLGWAAGSSVDAASALAEFYRVAFIGFPIALVVATVALGVSIAISRDIRRALDALAREARRIGSGELDRPVHLQRPDEIGDVALSLEAARASLEDARRRSAKELETTRLLLQVSQALTERVELQEVLRKLSAALSEATAHARSFVFFADEQRRELTCAASAGTHALPPGMVFSFDSVSAPTRRALAEQTAVIVDFDALPDDQRGDALVEQGSHLAAVVPLAWQGRLVGVVGVDDPGERREFTDREINLIRAIAAQASTAIENARLFQEQARGRELAEELDEVNRVIHSSLDSSQTMRQTLELAGNAIGASAGALFFGEEAAAVRYQYGFPEEFAHARFAGEMFPFARLMEETLEPVPVGDAQMAALMNPDVARLFGVRSLLAIPLLDRGRLVGGIGFVFGQPHDFAAIEIDFARKLSASVSLALENSRLHDATQRELARTTVLKEAAAAASTLDAQRLAERVLETVQRLLGVTSGVVYRVDDEHGILRALALCGYPPHVRPLFEDVALDERSISGRAVLHDQTLMLAFDELPEATRERAVAADGTGNWWVAVPVHAHGKVIGSITLVFDTQRRLDEGDTTLFASLADQLGVAMENARLYESERSISQTLQTALLGLPERIPGVEFAHLYHSATEAARVGGDFYDLFELEHGRIGITVGDISGHGIDAAVLTSLVKNAIRVQASQEDKTPSEVMASASEVLFESSPSDIFATAFFGVLRLDDGCLEYCSAGHTTTARICANGGVRRLPANSPLIGAFPDTGFKLSTERIEVDDLLFLYTDGLTEARRGGTLFGEDRLFDLLAHERGGRPEQTMRTVVDEVLSFADGRLSDDLAILVVERSAADTPPED